MSNRKSTITNPQCDGSISAWAEASWVDDSRPHGNEVYLRVGGGIITPRWAIYVVSFEVEQWTT